MAFAAFLSGDNMMNEEPSQNRFWERETFFAAEKRFEGDRLCLMELISVLRRHPAGLRRWSIMRTIRKNRELAGTPIPQKMEDDIEQVFRSHCADSESFKKRDRAPETALFHWPQGKVGGVWAVYPDRAEAWLKAEGVDLSI
jgi:hypothetical protein